MTNVSTLLHDYVAVQTDRTTPVVKLASPDQLMSEFTNAGVSMRIDDNQESVEKEELLEACKKTLEYSVKSGHPFFFNQLTGRADPVSIAADWLSVAANCSVFTYEVAPVFTLIENELLQKLGRVLGGDYVVPNNLGGLFVPGGSLSNMYAMHLARHQACPEINAKGLQAYPQLVAFTNCQSHYSYLKACRLLGIGHDNLVGIECDEMGGLKPEALEKAILKAKSEGKLPFFIGATIGTTVRGGFDPCAAICDIGKKYNIWVHADGAWGGSVLLASNHHRSKLLTGAERADSFSWNAHKMMGAPIQCSAFITRRGKNLLQELNGSKASYLFQPDKLYTEFDKGDSTIQCGRKADAFKWWLMWKAYGDKGLQQRIDYNLKIASYTENKVNASNGNYVMTYPRASNNVCFWVIPSSMGTLTKEDIRNMAPESQEYQKLASVAVKIKAEMQKSGDAMIGFQPLDGYPNFFRIVFPSTNVTTTDIDGILERMLNIANKFFP